MALVLLVGGCREPEPAEPVRGRCEDAAAGAACMELGLGTAVSPMADESDVELVFGPQGGWHVELGVRLLGIDAEGSTLTYEARREDDGAVVSVIRYGITPRRLAMDGDYLLRSGDLVIFDIASDDEVLDRLVTIEARLEDASGSEIASDVRTIRIVDLVP